MRKSERGSATLLVFATVMFMLIALSTILTSVYFKNKSQLTEMDKLRDAYTTDDMEDAFKEKMGVSADTYVETKSGLTQISYKAENGEEKTVDITAENAKNYYGWKVTNYNPTAGGTYRIFYYDAVGKYGEANTLYLKRDWTANDVTLSEKIADTNTDWTNRDEGVKMMRTMNPAYAKSSERSAKSFESYGNLPNDNERATAWLCDTTQFKTYVDSTMANFAIGSPSAEMYCDSYNQVTHNQGSSSGAAKLTCSYQKDVVPGYIYQVNGTKQNDGWITNYDTVDLSGYHGMYLANKTEKGEYHWWLASPSAYGADYVWGMRGGYARLASNDVSLTVGVCPAVSLKSGVQLEIVNE